ncbi:MAG: HisA/HisF-related TIM barrel protein, partial [Candidatus Nanopelagicales bacterium]
AVGHAIAMENAGAGELLLTSIDREGTMEGYDLETLAWLSSSVSIPVIAHGGCRGPEDMFAAICAGASAVAAGALFQFTDHTPRSCAQYLHDNGIEVRL